MTQSTPELAVILVNWNNERDTADCLDSLENQTYDDVLTIVVDNGSEPESFEYLHDNYEWPVFLRNEENLGFTGGNNRGIKEALDRGCEWVFLLNNDTVVHEEFLADLVTAAKQRPETTGIVGPKVHTYEGDDLWAAGGEINYLTGTTRHRTGAEERYSVPEQVDYVVGAAMLVRADVFEEIGLLDDDFFIYYEETEFCLRAAESGWDIWYVPVSGVEHKESVAFEHSPFRSYYLTRNRALLAKKRFRSTHRQLVFWVVYLLRWVLAQAVYLALVEKMPDAASNTLAAGIDAVTGVTGKRED